MLKTIGKFIISDASRQLYEVVMQQDSVWYLFYCRPLHGNASGFTILRYTHGEYYLCGINAVRLAVQELFPRWDLRRFKRGWI